MALREPPPAYTQGLPRTHTPTSAPAFDRAVTDVTCARAPSFFPVVGGSISAPLVVIVSSSSSSRHPRARTAAAAAPQPPCPPHPTRPPLQLQPSSRSSSSGLRPARALTAACVARSCSGQLEVKASPKTLLQAQELARWLGTHSSLPRSLAVEVELGAAELAGGDAANKALCAVLPSLTGLQSLLFQLCWPNPGTLDTAAIAAAIKPLTRLTALTAGRVFGWEDLQLFPASLQQVIAGLPWFQQGPRQMLQLGHLTALTDLDVDAFDEELVAGPDGDVLPPNLVRLRSMFTGAGVLKGLPSLKHLDGPYRTDHLVEFAAAGLAAQLTHVGLCLEPKLQLLDVFEDEEGDVLLVDPSCGLAGDVKRLQEAGVAGIVRDALLWTVSNDDAVDEEFVVELNAALTAELRRLPNLQALELEAAGAALEVDVHCLVDLTQLTSLRARVDWSSDDYAALPGVLARLPSLREVCLRKPNPDDVPAAVRGAFYEGMAGLTHLTAKLW